MLAMGCGVKRIAHLIALAVAGVLVVAGAASAAPLVDHFGAAIPNTEAGGRVSDPGNAIDGPITRVAAGGAQVSALPTILQPLGLSQTALNQPAGAGSPNSPEEDLAAALDALAAAPTQVAADAARQEALDILEGNTNPANLPSLCPASLATPPRAYCGIPLLNWQPQSKQKTVTPGVPVQVRIVRFGEHELTDTSLLSFVDPNQPFTIHYIISELGGSDAGDLTPTPLLSDSGGPVGGMHSAVVGLSQREVDLGSTQTNRFTTALATRAQPEHTSIVTQQVDVAMPPPRFVTAILDPNLRDGHTALSTILPADGARLGALAPNVAAGAAKISDAAPEKQIWNALNGLNTANV